MQVIIDLHVENPEVIHTGEKAKRLWEADRLYQLLARLEERGYQIHSLFGLLAYDAKRKELVDIGRPGDSLYASYPLALSVYDKSAKLAIVFTEKKYVVFANSYFPAVHLLLYKSSRPISVEDGLECFEPLFIDKDSRLLDQLYIKNRDNSKNNA